MTTHPRLRTIPGCETHPHLARLARHETTALMASDALRGLTADAACDVVQAHFEARPDTPPARLMALANALAQRADQIERERRG